MRSSEEMGYAIYQGLCKCNEMESQAWDTFGYYAQKYYVTAANAALDYLFEHGRISSYVNAQQLEEFSMEYRTYLAEKNGWKDEV